MNRHLPQRIVCLTTETVEVLYALGEQERIVGISGYTVRPPEARKEKPKVFAFTSGDIDKILATQPDLVLTFSDLQATFRRDLIKAGVPVYAFNHAQRRRHPRHDRNARPAGRRRSQGLGPGRRTGGADRGNPRHRREAPCAQRPETAVYFEEWDEPLISGIRWASELIEWRAARTSSPSAPVRRWPRTAMPTAEEVIAAHRTSSSAPGAASISARNASPPVPGWANIPAVR
jgi:iron complex transport system substrate-binding protein